MKAGPFLPRRVLTGRSRLHRRRSIPLFLWLIVLALPLPVCAERPGHAAIASAHPLATQAGFEMLDQGGNAFDAAIAVGSVLAVVEPSGSGLGGGGFWLLKRAADGREVMLDGRERAPRAARPNLYLDASGKLAPGRSIDGPLAAGIPGVPAALVHLATRYGRLPLSKSLAPAIRQAENGFAVGEKFARYSNLRSYALQASASAAAIFLPKGVPLKPGERLRQPDLAETLRAIARFGRTGFYGGATAQKLVEGIRAAGGIWTLNDLAQYHVLERQPIRGTYRGIRITSAAPPSAGGIGLLEMLNLLSEYDIGGLPEAARKHLLVEAMRRAYRDREVYLGDPDFVNIPVTRLLSPDYAAGLRTSLRLDKALPSSALSGQPAAAIAGDNTTHYSILDRDGNAVAGTLSINYPFGSGFVAPGTGVLLNDEMDDFATQPGTPNVYGLVGGTANAIAPGKRMLSSMTPTFVDDGRRFGLLGTPGGSRIITMVLLGVLDFAKGKGPESWVAVPRFHHQYLPDVIEFEPGAIPPAEQTELQRLGHTLKELERSYGDMHAVLWDKQSRALKAASDPRGEGSARVE